MKKVLIRRLIDLEMLVLLIIVLFSTIFFAESFSYNRTSALFPQIICSVILVLSAFYIVKRVMSAKKEIDASVSETSGTETGKVDQKGGLPWYISVGGMIVYLILIYSVGFTVATMCYGIAMPLIAHYRKVKTVILFAIGMVLVILIGFGYFFKIPLPWDIITDNFNIFY